LLQSSALQQRQRRKCDRWPRFVDPCRKSCTAMRMCCEPLPLHCRISQKLCHLILPCGTILHLSQLLWTHTSERPSEKHRSLRQTLQRALPREVSSPDILPQTFPRVLRPDPCLQKASTRMLFSPEHWSQSTWCTTLVLERRLRFQTSLPFMHQSGSGHLKATSWAGIRL